jgi:twinkle protein
MKWKQTHQPCPCGESSDGYSIRADGTGYCFSAKCKNPNFNNKKTREDFEDLSDDYVLQLFAHRGISENTFKKFNIQTKFTKSGDSISPHSVGFIYPNGAVKVRLLELSPAGKKQIYSHGNMSGASLFLKNYFDAGSRRCITIVEGEYDALTVAELLGNESAVVSVRSASSAREDCKAEWEYINSFEKIIINMDSDEAGQEAAKKILPLFDFKKIYNLVLNRHKDANGYIWDEKLNKPVEDGKLYYDAWRGVKRHTPDNIVSGNEEFYKALMQEREACIGTYPLQGLQQKLYGLHAGEVIVLKAMEGVGKTEVFRFIENHLLKTTNHPIGIIHLEEDNGTTLRGIAAYYSNSAIHLPDSTASVEDLYKIIREVNGENEDRLFLRSAFDVEDEDEFINGIRFLVSVCGCRFIFMDHISWLATGGDDQDERKKLDRISQRLKLLAKELGFALIMISHVNDDGKTRGSRNISKVANTVISINRDLLHADEAERFKTYFDIEKARLMGARTGPAGFATYDPDYSLLRAPPMEFMENAA